MCPCIRPLVRPSIGPSVSSACSVLSVCSALTLKILVTVGKTSLINSFVNRNFPARYVRTEKAVVYHKKTLLQDDTAYDEVLKPMLLEIEDTPGSERGFDEEDDGNPSSSKKKTEVSPKIMKGSRVVVLKDKQELMQLFDKFGMQSKGVVYKRGMENMLGKQLWLSSGPTCIM
eukprot:s69_g9.t1